MRAKYVHTNLVAKDWRALADFYIRVFGCVPVPPERDYTGAAFDALTGIPGARLRGMHLRMPGYGDGGPTLELFEYAPELAQAQPAINRQGFAHIAFEVDDVPGARDEVLRAGGRAMGEIVSLTTSTGATVTLIYVTDPEGNIIELQRWEARP